MKGLTQHHAPGFQRKRDLSPLKYVQSVFKIEGNQVPLSLGTHRQDGVKRVSFRISHRPNVPYERIRQLSILYDKISKISGQLQARLMVEVKPRKQEGTGRVAIDLGETILMACVFDDGTASLYSGRQIKAIRRYWQKVRANVKPNSRRGLQISHKERKQVDPLLHIATRHLMSECLKKGVKEIAIGDLSGIRKNMDYGDSVNQRIHSWPYRKIMNMIQYKGQLAGMEVRDHIDERNTSRTCHSCGQILVSNRKHRFLPLLLWLEGASGWKWSTRPLRKKMLSRYLLSRGVVAEWHGP